MARRRKPASELPPERTIGRLSLYRRLLIGLQRLGITHVFSHQLAEYARVTAAQVRRDLMAIGYSGSTQRGYDVDACVISLADVLDRPGGQHVALVGVGHLGRALLNYFAGRRPNLSIVAAFDVDPDLVGHRLHGCECHSTDVLTDVLHEHGVTVAIVAVPGPVAQTVADKLVAAGIRGILNFAPVRLSVPDDVFVEDLDVTTALETVAFYAHRER